MLSHHDFVQVAMLVPSVALVNQQTLVLNRLLSDIARIQGLAGTDVFYGVSSRRITEVLRHHITVLTPAIFVFVNLQDAG